MLTVIERKIDNQIVYDLRIEEDGKIISQNSVKFRVADVDVNGYKYLFIYDHHMCPIEDSYLFLNEFLREKSLNTKYVYMNALKILYSFLHKRNRFLH